ncbi:MAG: diacylglycerol kinase family protein [Candidatus Sericytochromatia bacterium]|nr:diacylglycerol kinase family protein [Candidatus Sericytochromatia bacterium]
MPRIRANNLFDSFKYAVEGIGYTIKTQRNMRLHLTVGIIVFIVSLYLQISRIELAILTMVVTMVIVAEMFNTAIESTIDLYSRQRHPLAKIAKDVAAAAVLISAISSALVGLLILGPPLWELLKNWLDFK